VLDEIVGATGRLYLDLDGRIHRKLAWAQFERGEPVALPYVTDAEEGVDESQEHSNLGDPAQWQSLQPSQ
jgi:hypothetical protein